MCRFEFFVCKYLQHWLVKKSSPVHREWAQTLDDPNGGHTVLDCARGLAKSTISRAFMLYGICEGDQEDNNLISRTGGNDPKSPAVKAIDVIKRELEYNQPLRYDYKLKKGDYWTQGHIRLIRGTDDKMVNFYSVGKRGSIRGSRGPIIFDDLQDVDDWRSETVLNRDEDWFFSDVYPIALEGQRFIFIGTIGSPISLISKVKQLKDIDGWKVLEYPVDSPVGSFKSIWPEQYSDDKLRTLCEAMTPRRFNAEYRCQPQISDNPVFEENQIQYYDRKSVQFDGIVKTLYKVTAGDGAYSQKKSADWTAIITLGATSGPRPDIYILDVKRGKWRVKDSAEMVIQVYDTWQQNLTFIESICNPPDKDAWVEEIADRERHHNCYINLRWGKPKTDKLNRAYMVQKFFQNKKVYFDREDEAQRGLINELLMFTGDGTFPDDQVDACVHALHQVDLWSERKKPKTTGPVQVLPAGEPNSMTGYV